VKTDRFTYGNSFVSDANVEGALLAMFTPPKDEDIINDAAAVKAIYDSIDEAVESINLSIILKASK
jgi:hypothetical protein